MYFTKSVTVAILAFAPSVVFGQPATGQSSAGSTGSSNGQNVVQLGAGGGLMFTPNMMTVNQGDNVTFAFMSAVCLIRFSKR
jgi:plastocyanin